MTSRSVALAASLAAAIGLAAPPAHAADRLVCRGTHIVVIDPGIGLEPSAPSFSTPEPGTMTCEGTLDGHRPTGPATYVERGRFVHSSCLSGGGEGTFAFRIPTDAGVRRIVATFRFAYPTLPSRGGLVGGTVESEEVGGGFDFSPVEGDCVTKPVTKGLGITDFVFG